MCERCSGSLVEILNDEIKADGVPFGRPCRACLTVRCRGELRAVAREWMGSGWDGGEVWRAWVPSRTQPRRDAQYAAVVPAYLPAGQDLLIRAIAANQSLDGVGGGRLGLRHRLQGYITEITAGMHPSALMPPATDFDLEVLPDGPPELLAGRVLVLMWEACNVSV